MMMSRTTSSTMFEYAHAAVAGARRNGSLLQRPCEQCGSALTVAHHDDYSRPLVVRWLCREHHSHWHAEHGSGANRFGLTGTPLEVATRTTSDTHRVAAVHAVSAIVAMLENETSERMLEAKIRTETLLHELALHGACQHDTSRDTLSGTGRGEDGR